MHQCVCGCPDVDHYGWFGVCNGPCGCSYFMADDGSEGGPTSARFVPYTGQYRKNYYLGEEPA